MSATAQMNNPDVPVFQRKLDESFATKAIHSGCDPNQWASKAIVPPITLATTFMQEEPGKYLFVYGRTENPNRNLLEECLAALEGGKHCLCFASGLAAISNVATLLSAGDHVLCVEDVYGGTVQIFKDIMCNMAIETSFIDGSDSDKFCAGLRSNTKLVLMEALTNPLLKIMDLQKITATIRKFNKNILIAVDNTFLTPYFLRPLELGVDIVIHSATKYINGHTDVTMGVVIVNDDVIHENLRFRQKHFGAVPSPFDCYLALRGLKTLQLRMDQHMKNGLAVARFLEAHSLVEKVIYPGLESHPQHELARRTWAGCSGMCSMYLKGGLEESKAFLKALKVFILGPSLGGYESLICVPLSMSPTTMCDKKVKGDRVTDNFFRLSIGLESTKDLIKDLEQALNSIATNIAKPVGN